MESYQKTRDIILSHASEPEAIILPTLKAIGHVVTRNIGAPISIPPFNNSAMDGVAFAASDTVHANETNPVRLRLVSEIAAGDTQAIESIITGTAVEIMTGGPMPDGADTVLPIEDVIREGDDVIFTAPHPANKHVRKAAEDIQMGSVIIESGTLLTEQHIPALTSLGISEVDVYNRTSVVWLSTGRELVDDLTAELGPNQIYNSSGPYGSAMMKHFGADLLHQQTVEDDGESFLDELDYALRSGAQVILSTGAVSAGKYDFVRKKLEEIGANIIVHKARVRPGKPILFATLPDGQFFFGLPGNPVSSAMSLRVFAAPFIAALNGMADEKPIRIKLIADSGGPEHLTIFQKARFTLDPNGQLLVEALPGQESFKVAPMLKQNCWLIHPEGETSLKAGHTVEILPLTPQQLR